MSHRGHNEGSIYQREDGTWVGAASLGKDSRGKAIRKYFYGKTRKDAKTKLDEALRNYEQGLAVGSKRQTLAKFLTDWLENNAKQTLRATTYRTYEQHIRLHINPEIGWHQLGELTPAIIQKFMSDKLNGDPPLAPRTVLYTRAVLRRALGQAVRWGMLPRNPAELVDPPRVARSEIKPLSAEEAQALLEAVKGHRLEAFYSVAVGLGLRRGEALGLMWEDIDFEAGTLRVVRGLQRLDHKLQLTEVKTETSRRTIKLPRFCVTALRAHRARQLRDRAKAGESWQNTGLVFTTGVGTPHDPRNVDRHFKQTLKAAGLPEIRLHDLRHSAASLLLAQGVPVKMVSEILGHSGSRITLDVYGHIFDQTRQQAADQMDRLFGNGA
jgi:integrase